MICGSICRYTSLLDSQHMSTVYRNVLKTAPGSEKSHKPNHCKPTPPPQGVAYCRHPSHSKFAIRHLASLVLQVFNPCSLSPIAAASSSSASVVFVCSAALPSPFVCRSRSRLRSSSSPFAFTRCSPFEFAFVWKPRCSASNSATNPRAPPSRRTALFCRRHEFPIPAVPYTHTPPILCFKLCNF
ncbi:hypothetical protein Ahy_A05g022163 [Arachis hypogaea]|uniref:Uncharacterized protein n=1 Tax=Arachis hypogaea TaxID=3818 RepID=A0A445CZX1_ARAHY|nr:hypothetical protein Ahy_A05g022163 [Arachis hypogaea]